MKFLLGLFVGIVFSIGMFVLATMQEGQPVVLPILEDVQQTIDAIGRPASSKGSRSYEATRSSSAAQSRSMGSRGGASSRTVEKVLVSSVLSQQSSNSVLEQLHAVVRTVRWTWPVPVVPANEQAVVGRILFRNFCGDPLTMSRIHMVYSGPNPFIIRGVVLINTSDGQPLTEMTPLVLGANRGKGEVDLLIEPPVTLESCEQDPTVPLEDRADLFSMDVVVKAHMDPSDWSVHTFSFGPESVTANRPILWDGKVNPTEGIFQFFTGKNAGKKSQEGSQ